MAITYGVYAADGSYRVTMVGGTVTATVAGAAADNAAISGNPFPIGGKYEVTPATLDDGDVGYFRLDSRGNLKVTTADGLSTYQLLSSAATTNATSVKATTGRLFIVTGYNATGALRYLKFYNKATAPTVGTDTPILTVAIPGVGAFALDYRGVFFTTGIAYALTTAAAVADTGALTAGDITCLNMVYV